MFWNWTIEVSIQLECMSATFQLKPKLYLFYYLIYYKLDHNLQNKHQFILTKAWK